MYDEPAGDVITLSPITSLSCRDHAIPAAYVLSHPSTGKRYVGSTKNLYNRISLHRSKLKYGDHSNKNLQIAFDTDPVFNLSAVFADSKETALDIEQKLLDEGHLANDLLNIAGDARRAGFGRPMEDTVRNNLSELAKVRNSDPVFLAALSDKMKVVMNNPVLRSAQSDRAKQQMNDPAHKTKMITATSRPVVVDGVQYPSIKEAAVSLGIKRSTLASRLNRQK